MSKWQPIKTAPKDGESILVYWPEIACGHDGEGEHVFVVYWTNVQSGEIWDYLDDDDNPEAKVIIAGGWRFTSQSLDETHTSSEMSEKQLLEWLHYSTKCGPTHWMPLPEPPNGE